MYYIQQLCKPFHYFADMPLQIGDLEYNITSYGSQAVSIAIQWTYPAMGPNVDKYTVTATADNLDSPIVLTDDRTRFTLTNLYYNTNYTISVTASNCNGVNNGSTLKIFERECNLLVSCKTGNCSSHFACIYVHRWL